MAGEKKGEAFEALIFLAIEALGYKIDVDFFWGKKPKSFSIDPDFIIGTLEQPTHWILATSSGSAKNSLEKFWRNLGELFEVKRNFSSPPKVVNLVLETNLRKALQLAMTSVSDAELLVQNQKFGKSLVEFIDSSIKFLPKDKIEKANYFREKIKYDPVVKDSFSFFVKGIERILDEEKPEFNDLWLKLRTEKRIIKKISAKSTYLRRGIAKLMVLPPEDRQQIFDNFYKNKKIANLPRFSFVLGFVKKTISGPKLTDEEIIWVLKNIKKDIIDYIIDDSYNSRKDNWDNWREILISARILDYHKYVLDNFDLLKEPKGMYDRLVSHAPNSYKWLFTHIVELLKFYSGKRQGYGYSVLSKDVGYTNGISQGYLELSDWVNGFLETPKSENLLKDVAKALSKRLSLISYSDLKKMGEGIEEETFRNLFEQKIAAYWLFEPLPLIIKKELDEKHIKYELVKKHPTFIGEYVGRPQSIASPTVITAKNTLICWRSAYDKGKHHKTKELMGRAQALRFEFDGKSFDFRNLKRMILVLDGTFNQDQLDALQRAGWDEIFYPDEMEKLKCAIV